MDVHIGISTCPNDTYAFHGLLTGAIKPDGINLIFHLDDVQQLNQQLRRSELDVGKASFHAALHMSRAMDVLPVGSALGYGVGPVLLAARAGMTPSKNSPQPQVVLCPGPDTTATMLYRIFYEDCGSIEQVVFSEIMPGIISGRAQFGVCIHEGRFTYQQQGLHLVDDLGVQWEQTTGRPLPLGGILIRRSLGADVAQRISRAIGQSLQYAADHAQEALTSMRQYAQEQDDAVLWSHVELYVNQWTHDLGSVGRQALRTLWQLACEHKVIAEDQPPLRVVAIDEAE